ncbi:hypothetical protein JCM11251_005892 [Rhodosporidiobolus azoricus]
MPQMAQLIKHYSAYIGGLSNSLAQSLLLQYGTPATSSRQVPPTIAMPSGAASTVSSAAGSLTSSRGRTHKRKRVPLIDSIELDLCNNKEINEKGKGPASTRAPSGKSGGGFGGSSCMLGEEPIILSSDVDE